jgi:signal transduction histidine kinase/ActR/RegA family two-component response regulator
MPDLPLVVSMIDSAPPERRSLKIRLAVALVAAASLLAAAYFALSLTMAYADLRRSLFERADSTADVLAKSMVHPMWEMDADNVRGLLAAAYGNSGVAAAWVDDEDGARYASTGKALPADATVTAHAPIIKDDGRRLGEVTVMLSLQPMDDAFRWRLATSMVLLLAVLATFALVLVRLLARFIDPVEQMSAAVVRYASGEKDVALPPSDTADEVGELARALRHMMTEIDAFEETLHRKVDELAVANQLADVAARAKREFLATMSHELRTPMNGILGMTQLLLAGESDAERREQLATIQSSADLLLDIVNQVLDLSSAESGELVIRATPFTVRSCVTSLTALHQPAMAEKQIHLTTHFGDNLPQRVSADAVRIRQVLASLIDNARKFTPSRGWVSIDVSVVRDTGDACVLRFAVSDNGVGILGDKQAAIFHAFTQVDGSHARRFGGTGVGLAIASRVVTLMGGELRVTSQSGRGSMFWFTVPVTKVPAPTEHPPATRDDPPPRLPGPLRVLLAEDNRINQKVAVRALERCGHQVTVVDDGAQAVSAVAEQTFDCVLMDLQMPGMDGTEATRSIRAREQDGSDHVFIVALTANALQSDRESCLAAGMDDYLTKPLKLHELEAVLQRAIERRATRWSAPHTSAA